MILRDAQLLYEKIELVSSDLSVLIQVSIHCKLVKEVFEVNFLISIEIAFFNYFFQKRFGNIFFSD